MVHQNDEDDDDEEDGLKNYRLCHLGHQCHLLLQVNNESTVQLLKIKFTYSILVMHVFNINNSTFSTRKLINFVERFIFCHFNHVCGVMVIVLHSSRLWVQSWDDILR